MALRSVPGSGAEATGGGCLCPHLPTSTGPLQDHILQPCQGLALFPDTSPEPWEPHPQTSRRVCPWQGRPSGSSPLAPGQDVQAATTATTSDQRAQNILGPGRQWTVGAERGDPRGSRSRESDLMVTLRKVVHFSAPAPPWLGAQPGDQALQRGASPRAPAMYKRAHPLGHGPGFEPTAHRPPSSQAPAAGSRPLRGVQQGSHPPGPSPSKPRQDPRALH